jgi:type II secretory pathway pseudopilin PulG
LKADGAPTQAPRFFSGARCCGGWSLVELVIVVLIASILSYVAMVRFRPLDAQTIEVAERLRNDLRHMQMLALAWGQPLRITVTAGLNGGYSVSCVTAGAVPCNVNPVIDPATGKAFSISLNPAGTPLTAGVAASGPGFNLDFDALGRPKNGAVLTTTNTTFTITGGGNTRTVVVSPTSGFTVSQ